MVTVGYPEIILHKQEHESLLARLREIILKVEIDEQPLEELSVFLILWFKNHTLDEDRKLTNYLV